MTKTTTRARTHKSAETKAPKSRSAKARNGRVTLPRPTRERRSAAPILVWEGVTLLISYKPRWLQTTTAHLEINVVQPEGAPLPVTDTGYRSHFLPYGIVEEAGGPVVYVQAWLDREARSAEYRRALERWRQLDLFA